jgi:signal transduction histidine kinase
MSTKKRSSLWSDVVLNLALLTAMTVGLNAVLIGKVIQGREVELRGDLAEDFASLLAQKTAALGVGSSNDLSSRQTEIERALEDPAQASRHTPWFAVVVTSSLQPVVVVGEPPETLQGVDAEAALVEWLVGAHDLRQAIAGGQTERGEWQEHPSFFATSYATASHPIVSAGRNTTGAVRVAVPIGRPLIGPMTRGSAPILLLSVLLSAVFVGLFGFVLFRRRILRPVEELVQGTRRVGQGEFATRLPPGASKEIGEVVAAFNEMARSLESYKTTNEAQLAELQAINEDLTQAREDLIFAEKMATVGRLAAGVAHEVGNPLASVIGFVDLLQREPDGEMARDLLPRIKAELDRINGIIRDLLNYSRPTGITGFELEAVDVGFSTSLAAVVDDVVQLVRLQPRFGAVEVSVSLPHDLPYVVVPADRLQQVLLNLFMNAAEAMGGQGTIHVRRVEPPEVRYVTLEVEDEGPGIDPRAGSNIYEPFFTTKEVGDGTGLGLAVSLRLVEKMGGKLRHLRDRQGGATFHLSLPVDESHLV